MLNTVNDYLADVMAISSGCENHSVHSSKTSYFVSGTSGSSCLLVHRMSKHLGHNSSAHFSGQAI